jgi:hypothetical protein
MLHKEFEYYLNHQNELIEKYEGRFIVIKNEQVIGDYSSRIEAYKETKKTHKLGTFIIQQCEANVGAYSNTFHSLTVSF